VEVVASEVEGTPRELMLRFDEALVIGGGVVQKWPVLGNTDNRDPAARQGQF
jgi:hypothetical protein